MATVHLIIKGKVQGVFYRASAKEEAEKLGLTGWVKNTEEGDVEVMVSGNNKAIEDFIDWCKRGPRNARVDDVTIHEPPDAVFERFIIKK